MLATSDYGRNIQKNINAVVSDEKFNQTVVRRGLDQKTNRVFESPIPLSVMFKDAKKFNIQNPIIGTLLSQVNANKISHAKVKELLSQAKDEELQTRLHRLKKRIDKSDDNNNNNNFDDSDDNDNNGGELPHRFNNLRYNSNDEELFHRYNDLRAPIPNNNEEEELLWRYNNLREPLFRDTPPSPPFPLRRSDIEKDDVSFLPPQPPFLDVLKIDFDRPITNLVDKNNNIIEMILKNEKQDLHKLDLYLSEQLSKLFPEVDDGADDKFP